MSPRGGTCKDTSACVCACALEPSHSFTRRQRLPRARRVGGRCSRLIRVGGSPKSSRGRDAALHASPVPGASAHCPQHSVWPPCRQARVRPSSGISGGCAFSPPLPGVHFQVKRVELQGPTPLFCCWLVKDLLHSPPAPAPRTHLLLASLPSCSHSVCELPGSSLGQVGLRPAPPRVCVRTGLSQRVCFPWGGRGSVCGFLTLSSNVLCEYEATWRTLSVRVPHMQGGV